MQGTSSPQGSDISMRNSGGRGGVRNPQRPLGVLMTFVRSPRRKLQALTRQLLSAATRSCPPSSIELHPIRDTKERAPGTETTAVYPVPSAINPLFRSPWDPGQFRKSAPVPIRNRTQAEERDTRSSAPTSAVPLKLVRPRPSKTSARGTKPAISRSTDCSKKSGAT